MSSLSFARLTRWIRNVSIVPAAALPFYNRIFTLRDTLARRCTSWERRSISFREVSASCWSPSRGRHERPPEARVLTRPNWEYRLVADAETLARLVLPISPLPSRLLPMLRKSVATVARFNQARPDHDEWRRIAIIVQMFVCMTYDIVENFTARMALIRLTSFIEENPDLLDFASWTVGNLN